MPFFPPDPCPLRPAIRSTKSKSQALPGPQDPPCTYEIRVYRPYFRYKEGRWRVEILKISTYPVCDQLKFRNQQVQEGLPLRHDKSPRLDLYGASTTVYRWHLPHVSLPDWWTSAIVKTNGPPILDACWASI